MSPIAPAIATPARSQFRSSRARVKSHVVVDPHASRVPSTPNRAGFTWTTFSESRRGAWWSRTIAGHGRPSTRSSWPEPMSLMITSSFDSSFRRFTSASSITVVVDAWNAFPARSIARARTAAEVVPSGS